MHHFAQGLQSDRPTLECPLPLHPGTPGASDITFRSSDSLSVTRGQQHRRCQQSCVRLGDDAHRAPAMWPDSPRTNARSLSPSPLLRLSRVVYTGS